MQQQLEPPALPGFVFDPARNRYFRAVKNTLGNPAESARPVKKKRSPIVLKVSSKGISSGGVSGSGSSTSAVFVPPNSAATVDAQGTARRGIASRARGLHWFVMTRRRGMWGAVGALGSPVDCTRRALAGGHERGIRTLRYCFSERAYSRALCDLFYFRPLFFVRLCFEQGQRPTIALFYFFKACERTFCSQRFGHGSRLG